MTYKQNINVEQGVDPKPKVMIGGSAAQSSTLQILDGLLNIEHDPSKASYCIGVRKFMLAEHRAFIEYVHESSR